MKRFRWRLSSLMWLAALAAAFLGGIRFGEYREAARRSKPIVHDIVLSPAEMATMATWEDLEMKVETQPHSSRTLDGDPSGNP